MDVSFCRVYEWQPADGDISIAWMHKLRAHLMRSGPWDGAMPMLLIPREQEDRLKRDADLRPNALLDGYRIQQCCGFRIKVVLL